MIVYVTYFAVSLAEMHAFSTKTIFLMKKISGEMFTVTPVFTYVNVSCFKQLKKFFTDGFEIRYGLNKIPYST